MYRVKARAISASYPDLPSAALDPAPVPSFNPPLSKSLKFVKHFFFGAIFVAMAFIACSLFTTGRISTSANVAFNASSTVAVLKAPHIIQRTEEMYTIRTQTIQDTTVHNVQHVVTTADKDEQKPGSSHDGPDGTTHEQKQQQEQQQKQDQAHAEEQTPEHQPSTPAASGDPQAQPTEQPADQQSDAAAPDQQQQEVHSITQQQQDERAPKTPNPTPASQQQDNPAPKNPNPTPTPQDQATNPPATTPTPTPTPTTEDADDEAEVDEAEAKLYHKQQFELTPTGQAEPAAAAPLPPAPKDFDWRAYLSFNPDLQKGGVTTEEQAARHFVTAGQKEKRLYKPLNITIRYTACGGLMNQHYSHISALALAATLNASLVLPPALSRNSFESYFSEDPKKNKVFWTAAPVSSMWDVDHIRSFWAEHGVTITEGPADAPLPDLARPKNAYPTGLPPGITPAQVARIQGVYLKAHSIRHLAAISMNALLATARSLPDPYAPLLLDCPCTLFMLNTATAPDLVRKAAFSLRFNPHIESLADTIILRMNVTSFNGLHLRMEDDAADWARILGGREKLLKLYLEACRKAGFDKSTPMYLASGLFTYGSAKDPKKQHIVKKLRQLSSKLLYKEQFLLPEDIKGLTKEQQALLDFLVMAHSKSFAGISVSTFSYYLREHRALHGLPRSSTVLVNGWQVGSDPLFKRTAHIPDV